MIFYNTKMEYNCIKRISVLCELVPLIINALTTYFLLSTIDEVVAVIELSVCMILNLLIIAQLFIKKDFYQYMIVTSTITVCVVLSVVNFVVAVYDNKIIYSVITGTTTCVMIIALCIYYRFA